MFQVVTDAPYYVQHNFGDYTRKIGAIWNAKENLRCFCFYSQILLYALGRAALPRGAGPSPHKHPSNYLTDSHFISNLRTLSLDI